MTGATLAVARSRSAQRAALGVRCRGGGNFGRGGGRGSGGGMGGSSLIIPGGRGGREMGGQQNPNTFQQGNGPMIPPSAPAVPPDGGSFYQPWRKPLDVMEDPAAAAESKAIKAISQMDEEAMLSLLTQRRANWHEMAKAIVRLIGLGITSELINEICGITPREQNLWVVASSVFYTVASHPDCPLEAKQYFNSQGQAALYELRVLNEDERVKGAVYCAEHALQAADAAKVTKAIKQYSLRTQAAQMEGFTDTVGDMYALMFYREAAEQKNEDRDRLATRGLEVAVSQSAKMSLQRLISMEDDDLEGETAFATLTTVSLEEEEQAFWPLPVIGTLANVTMSMFNNVPSSMVEGPYKLFKAGGGVKFTALPLFGPLASAEDPVGVIVSDTSTLSVPNLRNGKRGDALLVVDREKRAPQSDSFFLVFEKSTIVGLGGGEPVERASVMSGRDIAGSASLRVAGKIVLAVRPSDLSRDGGYGASGDAVMKINELD